MVRPLNLPNREQEKQPEVPQGPRVRPLNIQHDVTHEVEHQAPLKPKTFTINHVEPPALVNKARKRTVADDLIDKARSIDPSIDAIRIRARIDTLLRMDLKGFLDWGNVNLSQISVASDIQSKIAGRMAQINASGWINDTMARSSQRPSLMDQIFATPRPPSYYEGMLKKCRAELMDLVSQNEIIATNWKPQVRDLQLDGVSLQVVADTLDNQSNGMIASNQARSLLAGYQTGLMLLQAIDNIKMQCAQFVQSIDNLLNVTLPNWKLANGSR